MLLTNACSKNLETVKCVCNSSTESDRQELPWDLNLISSSLSSDSVYYEEKQFSSKIDEPPIKPCQSAHKSSEAPAVEIHDESTTPIDLPPISWHGYNCVPKFLRICNTGQNVLINGQWLSGKPYIQGGPLNGSYMFSQIHFHSPSEHEIDGKRYPLEMHVVHYKTSYLTQERAMEEKDGTVVLVYLFQVKDTCDTALSCFTKQSSHIKAVNNQSEITGIALNHIVKPFYSHYYIYWGSISTKKNSYLLQWIINCSNLYATKQEVHDLFHLMGSGDSYDERRAHLMKPLNNAVYYAGGYSMAFINSDETATQCSNCYYNQVSLMSQCCQTVNNLQEKKKDVQLQVSSSDNCSYKSSEYIKFCFQNCDAIESCEKKAVTDCVPSSAVCVYEDEKNKKKTQKASNFSVEVSLADLECQASSNKQNCVVVNVPSKPTLCMDAGNPRCQSLGKPKKKQKINIKSLKFEKSCSKESKKKKNCSTEGICLTSESKGKQVTCKEKPKSESKAKPKKKDVREGELSRKSRFSRSKSKCKVKVTEGNENVITIKEEKENCNKMEPTPPDCTVNFLLTPNTLKSIPSFALMTSESEEIKKIADIKDAKVSNFKVSEKTSRAFASNYQLPQPKAKEPLTEFFLQTEHLFHTEKKGGFSVCTSQDYNVTIIFNQNILQEFKGTFSPKKLELGNYEKLNLIPKYPEPDNVIVRLEDCIVKMETLDQLYIRAKFLLKQSEFKIVQGVENPLLEKTATESERLVNPEPKMKLVDIQKKDTINEQDCAQLKSSGKLKKRSSSKYEKQKQSLKCASENVESKKQDYEIEFLKGPPDEVETSKSNILDYMDLPCKTKINNEKSQKSLTVKSDKALKNLFRKHKKTLFFTYEKVEKDESSGKKVLVGKFRTKNEMKALSKEKKLFQNSEPTSTTEKTVQTKQESFYSLPSKELIVEEPLKCESPMEPQELKIQSFPKRKEPYKLDNEKNMIIFHYFNPENFKPRSIKSKRKHTTFQDQGTTVTPDIDLPQNVKLQKSNVGFLTIKIQKSSTVMDFEAPQIIIPLELDTRKFKQTDIEVLLAQHSESFGDKNAKKEKEYIPCLNFYD